MCPFVLDGVPKVSEPAAPRAMLGPLVDPGIEIGSRNLGDARSLLGLFLGISRGTRSGTQRDTRIPTLMGTLIPTLMGTLIPTLMGAQATRVAGEPPGVPISAGQVAQRGRVTRKERA